MRTAPMKTHSESSHHSLVNRENQSFFTAKTENETPFFSPVTIQPKLKIGSPDDQYEQQADRIADSVVQSSVPDIQQQPAEEEEEMLQMKCKECEEEELQMKSETGQSGGYASSEMSGQVKNPGSGTSLPGNVNQEMSEKIGADFSDVNIHTGSKAAELSESIGARAFTHKKDIFFNSGEYNPASVEGKHLLAHELTHVVQQGQNVKNKIQKNPLSDRERRNYVDNIRDEMLIAHTDYNNGAQDAERAIESAQQAQADIAKAIFSVSMAIIVPGFGGVISSGATRFGLTVSSSVADHIGGVIGEAAKIAGERKIDELFQSDGVNQLFVSITNGLEEASRTKREFLIEKTNDRNAISDGDLVELRHYWRELARKDRNDWNVWFQEKYRDFQQQIRPIGQRTDGRYGTNRLRWIEGRSWKALALTGEGRYFMSNNRPTHISWISRFYREAAIRKMEQLLGTQTIQTVHYTNLITNGRLSAFDFSVILDNPSYRSSEMVIEESERLTSPSSSNQCPTCHGESGSRQPSDFGRDYLLPEDFSFQNQSGNTDTEELLRWIQQSE